MAVAKKGAWGGPRKGSGRKATGSEVRRNRVTIMLTDSELAKLQRWAEEKELPFGTVAYGIVARALARRK